MAKTSVIARQLKRERMVEKYAAKREALKKAGDYTALDKMPRNGSSVRLRNRCKMTGRARGYIKYFGVSRLVFRDMASQGRIPGIRRSSW
jgi:small subunit ribosomal protein S14